MDDSKDDYEPSHGLWYALAGVAVFVVGGVFLTNAHGEDGLFIMGLALDAAAIYLLLAGGVARGIQLARGGQAAKHHQR